MTSDITTRPGLAPVEYDPFAGASVARVVPTTEAQRELWLADQLGREASLAYNESVTLQISGMLDPGRLQSALHALCERHDAQRATISEDVRRGMIAEGAYLRAERRGFAPGHEEEDWLAAETEVDALLKARSGATSQ